MSNYETQTFEHQNVEHNGLVYIKTVTIYTYKATVEIGELTYKVYKTGNNDEKWTTNISLAQLP